MPRPRLARGRVLSLLGLGVVLAFYAWTAFTNARTFPTQMDYEGRDYFNLQTDAFLAGRASLLVEPRPELLALEDPYDPKQNYLAYRVHDLSLYDGRYYAYWGPTPVLTFFLPARLVAPDGAPERLAILLYAFAGLLLALALLRFLARRFAPEAPGWMLALGGLALATLPLPYVLRRPTVYEVALTAGFCFATAALYLLATGVLGARTRPWRLLGAGVCLGLAIDARPNLALVGAAFLAALVLLRRRGELRGRAAVLRTAGALLGPPAGAVGVLLVYNWLRFDSFLEFGPRLQLNDVTPIPPGGFGHVLPSLYAYLLAPPRPDLNFPFLHLPPPPALPVGAPAGYSIENVGGLLALAPVVLFALPAIVLALRAPRHRALGRVLLALVGLAALLVLGLSVVLFGAAARYLLDFAVLALIAGILGWIVVSRAAGSARVRRAATVGGAALVLYGALAGTAISFTGETDGLRGGRPETYAALERLTSPLPTAVTMLAGGPVIVEAGSPAGTTADVRYGTAGAGLEELALGRGPATLEIVSPGGRTPVLRATVAPGDGPPAKGLALVAASPAGEAAVPVPPGGTTVELPLELPRGRSLVALSVRGVPPPRPGENPERAVLRLLDPRLAEGR